MSIQPTRKAKPQPAAPLFHGQSSATAGMVIDDDYVTNLVLRLRRICPQVTDAQAQEFERSTRDEDGGDTPYIAKRLGDGRSNRNEAIRRDFQRGESVAFLSRR